MPHKFPRGRHDFLCSLRWRDQEGTLKDFLKYFTHRDEKTLVIVQVFCSFPYSNVIAHDRSKEFHRKFNRPVATKIIPLQNPLLRFHKTTKGNFSGEDF